MSRIKDKERILKAARETQQVTYKENTIRLSAEGRPRGLVVKCTCPATGGPGLDPGHAPMHHFSGHAEAASHIQQLEGCATMTYNYLLGFWGEKGKKRRKIGNGC